VPLDAASRAAAAVGSSPATETSVDGIHGEHAVERRHERRDPRDGVSSMANRGRRSSHVFAAFELIIVERRRRP
jgi:hypothetical protein